MPEAPNSLRAFSRSIVRASGFADLSPRLRRVLLPGDEEVTESHRHLHHENSVPQDEPIGHGEGDQSGSARGHDDEQTPLLGDKGQDEESEPDLAPLRSKLSDKSHQRVQGLAQRRDESQAHMKDDEREHLLISKVQREDGTEAEVIIGQSTLPQTVFNSCNVLIGVGLLSLPLGIRYAGWVLGLAGLVASAFVTKYTAGLLAKCLDVDTFLANFADVAYVAFGETGRVATSLFITLELLLTCVGLVILFADTLHSLVDGRSVMFWKITCGYVLAPLNYVPMRWLGFTGFLGIFCSILIIVVAFVMGFLKSDSPGSLLEVAPTTAYPENWATLPLSFGLIMALWAGHSVFPNIYRDMRHPTKYGSGSKYIFGFVTSVDIDMVVIGYLLFGSKTGDEITTNIIEVESYPWSVKVLILVLIAIMPLTKFPLEVAPIASTLEVFTGIVPRAKLLKPNRINKSKFWSRFLKLLFPLLVTVVSVVLATAIPSFETISALMGGIFGFLVCIIVPVAFHLKIFNGQISRRQLIADWMLIIVSAVLAVVGTVREFLPRSLIGME